MARRYIGEIELSAFNGTKVVEIEDDDGPVKGIFIPFQDNGLYYTDRGRVKCYITAYQRGFNINIDSHYIKVYTSKRKWEYMQSRGYTSPIIGKLRDMKNKTIVPKTIDDVLL